jgi:hypothetical protein
MNKKVLNILFIIGFIASFMPAIYSIIKLIRYIPFLQKYGLDMPGETLELTLCFSFIALISILSIFIFVCAFIYLNRAELTYTKEEIAAKVAAMKQARQERKESAQREKDEQKKADLQRQLDELNRKDGE